MKVCLFAHTPPPHHGQSRMVELLLQGFGGDHFSPSARPADGGGHGIECHHVNARFAKEVDDIGKFSPGKALRVLGYCLQAIRIRLRGARVLYYVPAPGLRNAIFRDWVILGLLRPFFPIRVFHWHAAGLGEYLQSPRGAWMRGVTHAVMDRPALSISPGPANLSDAALFRPMRNIAIPNGIPDPCPEFEGTLREVRRARQATLSRALHGEAGRPMEVTVLFMALCSRDKGLMDTVAGVAAANRKAEAGRLGVRFHLRVAGKFLSEAEEADFNRTIDSENCRDQVTVEGFISGERKRELLWTSDFLCFPTYYFAENLPVSVIESMAHNLPVITSNYRAMPSFFSPGYPGLVDVRSPEQIGAKLLELTARPPAEDLRAGFLARFTLEAHLRAMAEAIKLAGNGDQPPGAQGG